jgi:hypothetical protein
MRGLATRLHTKRLAGLYVEVGPDGLSIPGEQVPKDEAERILSLAEARLELAQNATLQEGRTKGEIEMQAWFLSTTQDPERRKLVFSGKSFDKLAELGSAKQWMCWLKDGFEKAEAANRELAQTELERGRQLISGGTAAVVSKWKVRIRLHTNSHSVRQGALNYWNERVTWIKLTAVQNQKDQLILELHLSDQVPIQSLWHLAFGIARSFVTAINIGTMGFWFWRTPTQVNKFYETIDDVTNKSKLTLEYQPSLKPDWGENRALTPQDIEKTIAAFVCLPGPGEAERHVPYNHYLGGLTFLSLNDVHWQCEVSILGNFLSSHRAMMEAIGELPAGEVFSDVMTAFLANFLPEEEEDRVRMLELCRAFEQDRLAREQVTLKDAVFAKLFCDAYFMQRVRPYELERLKARQNTDT